MTRSRPCRWRWLPARWPLAVGYIACMVTVAVILQVVELLRGAS